MGSNNEGQARNWHDWLALLSGAFLKNRGKTVYFVLKSPYIPSGRLVKKFETGSVLSWFHEFWNSKRESIELTGIEIPQLRGILNPREEFQELFDSRSSIESLRNALNSSIYSRAGFDVQADESRVEILSDDGESQFSFHWFDENFADKNQHLVSWITLDKPSPTLVKKDVESSPKTWVCFRDPASYAHANRWGVFEIDGKRIGSVEGIDEGFEFVEDEFEIDVDIFADLLSPHIGKSSWSDALQATADKFKTNGFDKSEINLSDHFCELFLHSDRFEDGTNYFSQLIVFDDVWDASFPDLSKSIQNLCEESFLFCDKTR